MTLITPKVDIFNTTNRHGIKEMSPHSQAKRIHALVYMQEDSGVCTTVVAFR